MHDRRQFATPSERINLLTLQHAPFPVNKWRIYDR